MATFLTTHPCSDDTTIQRSMVPSRYFITSKFMNFLVSFLNSAIQHVMHQAILLSHRNPKRRKNNIQMPLSRAISVYKMNKRCPISLRVSYAPPNCPVYRHDLGYHHLRTGRHSRCHPGPEHWYRPLAVRCFLF
ncbi:hypothetical protein Ac2012v2_006691 [Leucoagaricus gongylophorus]